MNEFLSFLAANKFEKRFFTLPEGADDLDLDDDAKEYYGDIGEFEHQEYYLLNDMQSPGEMDVELDRLFNQFKIYSIKNNIKENKELSVEISNQLKKLHKEIEEGIIISKSFESKNLDSLFSRKLSYCNKALDFLKSESKKEPGQKRSKIFYSYEWLKDPDELIPKAYYLMVGKWIGEETKLEYFRNIFSKKPIGECRPIRWYEDAINGLVFFIMRMKEKGVISDENNKTRSNHILLKTCFLKPSGEPFHQKNPKTTKANIHRDIAPAKKDAIDDLIEKIIS